jgi:multidrug efflux pump subunit AcrA (membrane-fusion protein)
LAAVAAVGLIAASFLPYPMTLTSSAVLEPVSRRYVHASADGYLEQILVQESQSVVPGQPLAKLRSPELELRVEEVLGQIRSLAEKRDGLRVAINQLSPNAKDALASQSRLSTELLMLDTQEKHAQAKLEFLKQEQSRLTLVSPIAGMVVAKDLEGELKDRPVKRGDSLFQVVDLEGDWRLNVSVADRDSGYIERHFGSLGGSVEYVFDSLPREPFSGRVTKFAPMLENRTGSGSYRTVWVNIDAGDATRAHMGATATVFFRCGEQPFWFVWSRPLVEFLQRRFLWFTTSQAQCGVEWMVGDNL